MADDFAIVVEGMSSLRDIENLPPRIVRAARAAVNKTVDFGRADSARMIRREVAFPARYLSGQNGRLAITKRAQGADLEGIITGRFRPTSLARFARGTPESTRRRKGVTVTVKPGTPRFMAKAFLIRLRAGSAGIDTQHNLGLAVRLKPGETIRNKRYQMAQWKGLTFLYGPSVDQVFDDVAESNSDKLAEHLEREFNRLLEL